MGRQGGDAMGGCPRASSQVGTLAVRCVRRGEAARSFVRSGVGATTTAHGLPTRSGWDWTFGRRRVGGKPSCACTTIKQGSIETEGLG
jgi:hypothetical protein